ncbi:MAG: hypothetical protein A2603_06250 [Bdellovibrionales bacterium RIFOXYD1_FULL_55_31]|nr:MAG: hypothetical protein A2603_06250 [Bdellovibrionales bacterium RIFOXYD1_FULL_55_31]
MGAFADAGSDDLLLGSGVTKKRMSQYLSSVLVAALWSCSAVPGDLWAREIRTNSISIPNPPSWLTERKVNAVVDRIQRVLEWDIRRVNVQWYADAKQFADAHGYGSSVLAFARASQNAIHLGPKVTNSNFDGIFGHELVHVILYQKYHDAVPKWLEEGLANHAARRGTVDYVWLSSQAPRNVRSLVHPFDTKLSAQSVSVEGSKYHYMASQALAEMIAARCSLSDLLQLSVGKKLEAYLSTFCRIPDVDQAFRNWLTSKKRAGKGQ